MTDRRQTGEELITVAYEAKLLTGGATDGIVIEREAEFKFLLGNKEAPECLELAVKEMSLHQLVVIICTQDQLLVPKTARQPIVSGKSDIYIQYSVQLLAIEPGIAEFADQGF